MKESYGEGVATHTGPESCAAARKDGGEALTGVRAGRVLSREIHDPLCKWWVHRGADVLEVDGRPHSVRRHREARRDPARSETPSMHGTILHGNREIPRPSAANPTATLGSVDSTESFVIRKSAVPTAGSNVSSKARPDMNRIVDLGTVPPPFVRAQLNGPSNPAEHPRMTATRLT